jgi:hypothetical protein
MSSPQRILRDAAAVPGHKLTFTANHKLPNEPNPIFGHADYAAIRPKSAFIRFFIPRQNYYVSRNQHFFYGRHRANPEVRNEANPIFGHFSTQGIFFAHLASWQKLGFAPAGPPRRRSHQNFRPQSGFQFISND